MKIEGMSSWGGGIMKQAAKVSMSLLVGFAVGAGVINALQAQGTKKAAYVIADVEVTDQAAFSAYAAKVPETLKPYNGRIVVRAKPIPKEGAAPPGNIVLIAFNSLEDAENWYVSPSYSPLILERQKAAKTQLYIVEGLPQ
jgi:uncharacterized protein (DUF1330 family)